MTIYSFPQSLPEASKRRRFTGGLFLLSCSSLVREKMRGVVSERTLVDEDTAGLIRRKGRCARWFRVTSATHPRMFVGATQFTHEASTHASRMEGARHTAAACADCNNESLGALLATWCISLHRAHPRLAAAAHALGHHRVHRRAPAGRFSGAPGWYGSRRFGYRMVVRGGGRLRFLLSSKITIRVIVPTKQEELARYLTAYHRPES